MACLGELGPRILLEVTVPDPGWLRWEHTGTGRLDFSLGIVLAAGLHNRSAELPSTSPRPG